MIFSFLRGFSKGIGVLLKNGAFVRFYCLFVGVFGYERAHSCAPVRKMSKKRREMKKSDAEFPMYCGFPTVSDKDLDRVKQESRGPIIGPCPLSLAGKLKYVYLLCRSQNNPLSRAGESRATKECRTQWIRTIISRAESRRLDSNSDHVFFRSVGMAFSSGSPTSEALRRVMTPFVLEGASCSTHWRRGRSRASRAT